MHAGHIDEGLDGGGAGKVRTPYCVDLRELDPGRGRELRRREVGGRRLYIRSVIDNVRMAVAVYVLKPPFNKAVLPLLHDGAEIILDVTVSACGKTQRGAPLLLPQPSTPRVFSQRLPVHL